MGNKFSSASARGRDAHVIISESEMDNANSIVDHDNNDSNEEFYDAADEDETRARAKEEEMKEFKKQLSIKREQRKEILTRHRTEKEALEKSLQDERTSKDKLYENNEKLRELLRRNNIEIPEDLQSSADTTEFTGAIHQMLEAFEKLKSDNNKLRRDLVETNSSLQSAYSDMADLNAQNMESMKQIHALKEVVAVSKTMIGLREGQLNELKNKLTEIEISLSDREANMLSTDLRKEYERQLQNIRTLRGLYEERARLAEVTRLGLVRDLEEHKVLLQAEIQKSKDLADKVESLEEKVEKLEDIIENKNMEISSCKDETNGTKAEMTVVNKLFSQVLLGYKTKQDLDKLVHRLEENHGLLTHMAENEIDSEASSALPKLLLELVSEVDEIEDEESKSIDETEMKNNAVASEASPTTSTAEEIVENLPKVWRVLMELLSHQSVADDSVEKITTCYKLVETKSGPVEVPSVSQTYIRLKDLIVEKLGLVKEVNRMKQLNSHLENRLQEQEKRLCLVTTELGKTWHVVGKLRRHHYQLHTHEKILKYELQQKRKLLNELKEELEYCREKWDEAREKNSQSERDWKTLRAEFTSRKTKSGSPLFNNSAESGYSDERPSDESSESNDESEYAAEPPSRCKKKMKKSFETIIDSSTDFNCAAEREDPVSDLLDVADLPLDTHDGDHQEATTSDISKSENMLKKEKTCETEDEICEITHDDSLTDEQLTENPLFSNSIPEIHGSSSDTETSTLNSEPSSSTFNGSSKNLQLIDPAVILMNIKQQNERLAKKDARLEHLERNSTELLNKIQDTDKISHEVNSKLDHLLNRPSSSFNKENTDKETTSLGKASSTQQIDLVSGLESKEEQIVDSTTLVNENDAENMNTNSTLQIKKELINLNLGCNADTATCSTGTQITVVDFKAIMENIKRQDQLLANKDKRLENLEKGCTEVVKNITNTLNTGQNMIEKLDNLHDECNKATVETLDDNSLNVKLDNRNSEPSSSTETEHEARFAARDIRLKKLEEQTKSLVNKVNKTTSKGVKIHYKLEELHNIYGSESSRAGTPSEENAERSNDEENDQSEPSIDENHDEVNE